MSPLRFEKFVAEPVRVQLLAELHIGVVERIVFPDGDPVECGVLGKLSPKFGYLILVYRRSLSGEDIGWRQDVRTKLVRGRFGKSMESTEAKLGKSR